MKQLSDTYTAAGFEDASELDTLLADAVAFYCPQNPQEQFAVERIALCQLAIRRGYRLEAGALTSCFTAGFQADPEMTFAAPIDQKANHTLAAGLHTRTTGGPSLSLLLRYQAQADRQYRRAVEDFERLAATRQEIPNEPIPVREESKLTRPERPIPVHTTPRGADRPPARSAEPAPGPWPLARSAGPQRAKRAGSY